ncbi:MAG: lectin-like protein [Candidatus Poribacteria bacterium]|nr:lectin-like protein [Candidatus Poribacteria bacterium]
MKRLHSRQSSITMLLVILVLSFMISWNATAQKNLSSISGKVIDENGKPVVGIKLAIKPVKVDFRGDMPARKPFLFWLRSVTDTEGRFSFLNIDPVSSQFAMFPEHGSDYEIISMSISDLTFQSTAFRGGLGTNFGKLTFAVDPGDHLENAIVNVKTPRTRIRGRVLLQDGTPLANEELWLMVSRYRRSPSGRGGGGGSSGKNVKTDNQGYFVTYNAEAPAENMVKMTYKGMVAQSEKIILNEGERYDDLVFVLKNIDRMKAREGIWLVNPDNGHGYRKIECDNWEDAKAKSASLNAHLVAINDEVEQKWLEGLFPEKAFFWIGLSVPENEASWQWDNGQPLTYTNWRNSPKPDFTAVNESKDPFAMGFYSKKWMVIGPKSPFLPSVKYAILEKEGLNVPTPQAEK